MFLFGTKEYKYTGFLEYDPDTKIADILILARDKNNNDERYLDTFVKQ